MQLTKNFTKKEFDSKDGAIMPPDVLSNVIVVAQNLQKIRDYIAKPINIHSGYRSVAHNKAVGGVANSYHLKGLAVDISVSGMTSLDLYNIIEKLIDEKRVINGGLILYDTFVHYDLRKTPMRLNNSKYDLKKKRKIG